MSMSTSRFSFVRVHRIKQNQLLDLGRERSTTSKRSSLPNTSNDQAWATKSEPWISASSHSRRDRERHTSDLSKLHFSSKHAEANSFHRLKSLPSSTSSVCVHTRETNHLISFLRFLSTGNIKITESDIRSRFDEYQQRSLSEQPKVHRFQLIVSSKSHILVLENENNLLNTVPVVVYAWAYALAWFLFCFWQVLLVC